MSDDTRHVIRVLQLFYEPLKSGITRNVAYLIKAVTDEPHDFWVVCSTGDHRIGDELGEIIGKNRVKMVPPGRFFSFKGFLAATRLIRAKNIRIIHVHNLQSALWGYAAAVFSVHRRIIFTPHVDHSGIGHPDWIVRWLFRFLRPFTHCLIALSSRQQWRFVEEGFAGTSQVRLIPNHIDESVLSLIRNKDVGTIRRKNNLPEKGIIVCQMARLNYQKDPFFLIRAAELTRGPAPEIVFVLVGDGPLRHAVEKAIREKSLEGRVVVMGYRNDGLELLHASDIVALTSRWEGLPYSLLEAACLKKPIIATNISGNQDLIVSGKSGYLVEGPEEFAEKLIVLAGSKELRERMGARAYALNRQYFSLKEMAASIRTIYA